MILFADGIAITAAEHQSILHLVASPEDWVRGAIAEKVRLRRDALILEWRPKLLADPEVTELPADSDAFAALIIGRADYRSRAQSDAEIGEAPYLNNIARYQAVNRSGSTVTLFPSGIDIPDADCNCMLAYIQDIDDWILGALLGYINRGKKRMLAEYHPIILADPDVTTTPATEDGLIQMITARSDYRRSAG